MQREKRILPKIHPIVEQNTVRRDEVMNKKQMETKRTNKKLARKVAPFVMSTSMMAATFLAAGAPISAAELEKTDVNPEVIEQVKNHGQEVSSLAKSLPGSPEKGKLVSELAKSKSGTTNGDTDEPVNIDETNNNEPQNVDDDTVEGDDVDAEEGTEPTVETPEAPATDEVQADDGTAEADELVEEGTKNQAETPEVPVAETELGTDTEEIQVGDTNTENTNVIDEEENIASENNTQNQDDSDKWVDETYEFIGDSYQSIIEFYQTFLEQSLNESDAAKTSEEAENVSTVDTVTDVTAEEGGTDTSTLEAVTTIDSTVDNPNINLTNEPDVNVESPVSVENEDQPSNLVAPEQEVVEPVENTVSDSVEPIQAVDEEIIPTTETEQINQNEAEEESDQISLKDKLIGYYQDLVASFSNLTNLLK